MHVCMSLLFSQSADNNSTANVLGLSEILDLKKVCVCFENL